MVFQWLTTLLATFGLGQPIDSTSKLEKVNFSKDGIEYGIKDENKFFKF